MKSISDIARRSVGGVMLVGALLLLTPAAALADSKPVAAPAIRGVPALPGPVAPAAKPAATMQVLKTTPDTGVAGKKMTIGGAGLQPNKGVSIVWIDRKSVV